MVQITPFTLLKGIGVAFASKGFSEFIASGTRLEAKVMAQLKRALQVFPFGAFNLLPKACSSQRGS